MIVCAAIKIKVTATNRETVICGHRHGDCFSTLADLGFRPHTGYQEICQGFLTTTGNFLDRHEAFQHAIDCGQLSAVTRQEKRDHHESELYSEDLY